jgi:hypothetical protein
LPQAAPADIDLSTITPVAQSWVVTVFEYEE